MSSEFVVGLDMGSTKVAVLIGEFTSEGETRIIGAGSAPAAGIKKGVVVNMDQAADSVRAAVAQAERMAGVEIRGVCAAVSGPHMRSFNSRGVIAIPTSRREVGAKDVDKVTEAARSITLPIDREIVHSLPQDFVVDNQAGIHDPVGMSATRLEADVHIVTALGMPLENMLKVSKKVGLEIVEMVFDPFAAARAVLARDEMNMGCLLIDVGGSITSYALYHGGTVRMSGVVGAGGVNVTNDLAVGLRTSTAVAEDLKIAHGLALASLASDDEQVCVPGIGEHQSREVRTQILAAIIEPRIEEIFTMVKKAVSADPFYRLLGAGIVLAGGTSRLRGMDGVAEEVFDLPVRIGRPVSLMGLSELVGSAEWTTGIGLLLCGRDRMAEQGFDGAAGRVKWMIHRVRRIASLF
ncbi:MAG: cell division protein FtsA [Candidatus Krumholzibacteriaceae bacterium]